ncbi:MAG: hypothetical protein EBZ36_12330 [Acidobacteria bacterium]|nr:hypothetical protein [Acidobacteriota bacterium]
MNPPDDNALSLWCEGSRVIVVDHRFIHLVAALLVHPRGWDISEDIVRVAGNPDSALDLLLQTKRIVGHHLAPNRDQGEVPADAQDLHRAGVLPLQTTVLLQTVEHPSGVTAHKDVRIPEPRLELVF